MQSVNDRIVPSLVMTSMPIALGPTLQLDELVIPISFADYFHLTQLCTTTSTNKLGACNLQTTASFNQTKPKETKSFSSPTPTAAIISTFQL